MNTRPMNLAAMKWLESRGLDPELAVRLGCYTATQPPKDPDHEGFQEPTPDAKGRIFVWPYVDRGREVNAKFRVNRKNGGKVLWQRPGGQKTFWNADVMDDPELHRENTQASLVICEGELDAMVAIQSGFPWAVSVPDGAPAARDAFGRPIPPTEGEPDPDNDPKYEYIRNNLDRLARVRRIIICTDGDESGQRLRDELTKRLDAARCCFVTYPQERVVKDGDELRPCKDLNEVLNFFGPEFVDAMLRAAKALPLDGVFTLDEIPEQERIITYDTGFPNVDSANQGQGLFRIYEGMFMVTSGLPGSGKSAWTLQLAFNCAALYGWVFAIASFEMRVKPVVVDLLRFYLIKKPREEWTRQEVVEADAFIRKFFVFIMRDPRKSNRNEVTTDWLIDRARDAHSRYGIKGFLLDPWNNINHARKGGETGYDYTNRAVNDVKDALALSLGIATWIVAHPTKEAGKAVKEGQVPTMYDISDGATWANAAETGIILHRESPTATQTMVYCRKVKMHRITGLPGDTFQNFDTRLEQFVD